MRVAAQAGALALHAGSLVGPGNVDGTGANARFYGLQAVAADAAGNIYVADTYNETIRKITPSGVTTTLAGLAGQSGDAIGPGAAARFSDPQGIAVDSAGNIYVADTYNRIIKKITPSGIVSNFAGSSGVVGSADGSGPSAQFSFPTGLATDSAGNVYVADSGNYTVRKITPSGFVTTLAGTAGVSGSADGTGPAASFKSFSAIASDAAANIYVADRNNGTVRKITPAGVVTTIAGTAGQIGMIDAVGPAAQFNGPNGICTDAAGNVYVSDTRNFTIRKISPSGNVSTFAGAAQNAGSTDGSASQARFNIAFGLAGDSAGNIYVADFGNYSIRKITPLAVVTTIAGTPGIYGSTDATGASARFKGPQGIATDPSGNIFVADTYNHTIRKVTSAGSVSTIAGTALVQGNSDGTGPAATFKYPAGVATTNSGIVYVADASNSTIRKITANGDVTTFAGTALTMGSADGVGVAARFVFPFGITADVAGNVFVADIGAGNIRKITPAGVVSTFAAANFYVPSGVAVDPAGNLFVSDVGSNTIRKITPAGVVSTLAGSANDPPGSADGIGAAARFNFPLAIATDANGNVYVADTGNHTIRKITPAGAVSTVVGVAGKASFVPGALPGLIAFPTGIAISGSTLYISMADGLAVATNIP